MSGVGHGRNLSKDSQGQGNGSRIITATRPVTGIGNDGPQEPVPGTQCPEFCPGEALLWRSSKPPGGTDMASGK